MAHRGKAKAQRHDERHGDRPGGDAARIEGHRQKFARHKGGQGKHQKVTDNQNTRQRPAVQCAKKGQGQKHTHAAGHAQNKHHIRHGGRLAGQHLQVRLGNGDEHANGEAHGGHAGRRAHFGEMAAGVLANGHHGNIGPQAEKSHSHNQKHGPHQKHQQGGQRHGGDGDAKHKHNQRHRQHGVQRFHNFFF